MPLSSFSFELNGLEVSLPESQQAHITSARGFEYHTLTFLNAWLAGEQEFTLQTSGSTGTPKSIAHTRQQMIASAQATLTYLQLPADTVAVTCIPTQFIGGRMMLVRAWLGGLPLRAITPQADALHVALQSGRVGFIALVPQQLEHFLSHHAEELPLLRDTQAIILGGGPVSIPLEEQIIAIPCPVFHTYGMTETVSHIALKRLNGARRQRYFEALPGVTLATDAENRLRIKAPVTLGEWLQTNDVVLLHGESQFEWLGRADMVINTGGIKVNPETLEEKIISWWKTNERSERFFILGMPHDTLGEQLVLVIEGAPWSKAKQLETLAALKLHLPQYQNPKSLRFVSKFVETDSGKIKRTVT